MFPLQLRLLTSWRYEILRARTRSFVITLLPLLDHGKRSLGLPFTRPSHCYGLCFISYLMCPFSCSLRMLDYLLLLHHALVTCSSSCISHMLFTFAIHSLSMSLYFISKFVVVYLDDMFIPNPLITHHIMHMPCIL